VQPNPNSAENGWFLLVGGALLVGVAAVVGFLAYRKGHLGAKTGAKTGE
jgi:hypothetical protein